MDFPGAGSITAFQGSHSYSHNRSLELSLKIYTCDILGPNAIIFKRVIQYFLFYIQIIKKYVFYIMKTKKSVKLMVFQSAPIRLVSTNVAVIDSSAVTAKMKSEPRFKTPSP